MGEEKLTWQECDQKAIEAYDKGDWNTAIELGKKAIKLYDDSDIDTINRLQNNQKYFEWAPNNKICVYSIARNESDFVDSWCEAHKGADKLVVVVHDCTDDTEEKLRSHGVLIKKTSIPEWRFDVGKNAAIDAARELAPDCNILIYASLDERFEPGWDLEFRKAWREDTDQSNYKFVQAIGPNNEDRLITYFVWATSNDPNWYYEYPVHEAIRYRDTSRTIKCINLFEKVKLRHYQDNTRPRSYQNLCEIRYKEFGDVLSAVYLARELCAYGRFEESIEIVKKHPIKDASVEYMDFALLYRIMGDDYYYMKKYTESINAYDQARMICPEYNDAYIGMGRSYCYLGEYEKAYQILKQGLVHTKRQFSWAENPVFFEYEKYSWLVVSSWNTGRKVEALAYAAMGLQKNPNQELAKTNLELCVNNITDMELGAI